MKKKLRSVFCVCMSLLLCFAAGAGYPAAALETASDIETPPAALPVEQVSDAVRQALLIDAQRVESIDLAAQEELNMLTCQTKADTETVRLFSGPVKFKEDGEFKLIDNTIKSRGGMQRMFSKYAFENAANSIKTYFPKQVNSGVLVEKNETSIELIPITQQNPDGITMQSTFGTQTQQVVHYQNAFGSGQHLQYAPVNTGLKENILLDAYAGVNAYSYIVKTDLIPTVDDRTVVFKTPDTKETKAVMQATFMQDSCATDPHFSFDNDYQVTKTDDGVYLLTMLLDEVFLTSESTVYPVLIDPNLVIVEKNEPGYDLKVIQTTTVYSGDKTRVGYNDVWNQVGDNGSKGEGLMYVKIHLPDSLKNINPEKLTRVVFKVREGSGRTDISTIRLFGTSTPQWTIADRNYNNRPSLLSTVIAHRNVSWANPAFDGWIDFNLYSLAKEWLKYLLKDGGYPCDRGFALKAMDPQMPSRHFCSHNNTSYEPSIEFEYEDDTSLAEGTYYIRNVQSNLYLTLPSPNYNNAVQRPLTGGSNQKWKVKKLGGGYYSIQTVHTSGNYLVRGNLYAGSPYGCKAIANTEAQRDVQIIKNADGTYRILKPSKYGGRAFDALDVYNKSTASGTQVIWYPYKGSDNERWVFEQNAGGAYRQINTEEPNCLGYALFQSEKVNPDWEFWDWNGDTEKYSGDFEDIISKYYPCRRIAAYNTPINMNEYRIAVRSPRDFDGSNFYHVIYQLGDGTWAGKDDTSPSQHFDADNPSTDNSMWSNNRYPQSCGTIYFAVERWQ